ncbi:unnamed protein product [Vicia faba]|uniref:Reverse transcriptase domain-containing protein n=1 Tax=Vicia faba TaxID=3906 RepID=A0AAV1AKJ9_VICFA|nr:unnamed protein product [Vicia faba]
MEGRSDFVLKEKLYLLKGRLKWWNVEVLGRIDFNIKEEVREVNKGESLLQEDLEDGREGVIASRKEATGHFRLNLRIKENMLIQNSRTKWLNEGDTNSAFFHKALRERRRHNHIGSISSSRGLLDSVVRRRSIITFRVNFLRRMWLEPFWKVLLSINLRSLFGVMVILKARDPMATLSLLSRSVDGVLVANELVDYVKKEGKSFMLFKVDFEKAYDKASFLQIVAVAGFGHTDGTIWIWGNMGHHYFVSVLLGLVVEQLQTEIQSVSCAQARRDRVEWLC